MALRIRDLTKAMVDASRDVFADSWPDIKDYARAEFKKVAESIATVTRLRVAGKITDEKAQLHLEIQKNAARMVMLTVEGLSLIMVERAINAAMDAVRDTVNTAVGFALL